MRMEAWSTSAGEAADPYTYIHTALATLASRPADAAKIEREKKRKRGIDILLTLPPIDRSATVIILPTGPNNPP